MGTNIVCHAYLEKESLSLSSVAGWGACPGKGSLGIGAKPIGVRRASMPWGWTAVGCQRMVGSEGCSQDGSWQQQPGTECQSPSGVSRVSAQGKGWCWQWEISSILGGWLVSEVHWLFGFPLLSMYSNSLSMFQLGCLSFFFKLLFIYCGYESFLCVAYTFSHIIFFMVSFDKQRFLIFIKSDLPC